MTKPTPEIRERVTRNGLPQDRGTPAPMLTLEEYFTGNDDFGSICCNIPDSPGPAEIWNQLKQVQSRMDVSGVFVEVSEIEDDEFDMWPYANTVWVITSADRDEIVSGLTENIRPDDIWEGWTKGCERESVDVPQGQRPLGLWWD